MLESIYVNYSSALFDPKEFQYQGFVLISWVNPCYTIGFFWRYQMRNKPNRIKL